MTATHQLGDALRGLRRGSEAEVYYKEVLSTFPRNVRTLVDLAKTYCVLQKWQRANDFLATRVRSLQEAAWHPDVQFYQGWALAGQVREKVQRKRLGPVQWPNRSLHSLLSKSPSELEKKMGRAMWSIDYALHQRPRYAARWEQNDWMPAFSEAATEIESLRRNGSADKGREVNSILAGALTKPFPQLDGMEYLSAIRFWLAWRLEGWIWDKRSNIEGVNSEEDESAAAESSEFSPSACEEKSTGESGENSDNEKQKDDHLSEAVRELIDAFQAYRTDCFQDELNGTCLKYFSVLRELREATVRLFQLFDADDEAFSLNSFQQQFLASQLIEEAKDKLNQIGLDDAYDGTGKYQETTAALREPGENSQPSENTERWIVEMFSALENNFCGIERQLGLVSRWSVDLYAELAILLTRLLIYGNAYEDAYELAKHTAGRIHNYREHWARKLPQFNFSPYVIRYQVASLRAWEAYALLQTYDDETVQGRLVATDQKKQNRSLLLQNVEHVLEKEPVFQLMPLHPLRLFVLAQLNRRQKLHKSASVELNHLLKTVAPFDPVEHIVNWNIHRRLTTDVKNSGVGVQAESPKLKLPSTRQRLNYLAKLSGMYQLEDIEGRR
jgi:hypothetical protein